MSVFSTSAKFWLGLQDDYDLEQESSLIPDVIKSIRNRMAGKSVSQIRVYSLFMHFTALFDCILQNRRIFAQIRAV